MNWKKLGNALSEQIQEASYNSREAITPDQAVVNAQLTYTARAFLQACKESDSRCMEDVEWLEALSEAAGKLPITPYEAPSHYNSMYTANTH